MTSTILLCPQCEKGELTPRKHMTCPGCGARYSTEEGVLLIERNETVEELQKKKPNWYVKPQKDVRNIYRHQHEIRRKLLEDAVKSISKEAGKRRLVLVDIGCGDGNNIEELRRMKNITFYGFDYNFLRLVRAKRAVPEATFVLAGMKGDAIKPNSVDIILLNHVIEHVKDDKALLRKLYSYLRPGGYLLLGTPQEGRFIYKLRNRVLEPYLLFITDHVQFYTDKELRGKMESAGYDITQFHYLNYAFPHSVIDRHLRKHKRVHDFFESFGKKHYPKAGAGALWVVARKPQSKSR